MCFINHSNIVLIRPNFSFCTRWERLLYCFRQYNYKRMLLQWHEKYGCCEDSVRTSSLTTGSPSVPISKVDIKHFENKITRTKCRFCNQTVSVISVYKVSPRITSKYQLCITGSLHLWYKTTHQIAICCGSGYPCLKKKSGSSTNTCKKSLPDGVNEDSDYLFSSWAEWERAERERKTWEMR